MFLSSHNLGGHRNRNSDVEDEGIRDPSSHIVNRFSTSSTDSQDGFEFTALINLQNLRSKVSRAGWGLKTCCWKRPSLVVIIVFIFLLVAAIIWISFIAVLVHRLSPRITLNGLHEIIKHWRAENPACEIPPSRFEGFSRDIQPVPCHSHNDYLRQVPLYQALEAGCMSVEADIWLQDNEVIDRDLYVGHSLKALKPTSTLKKLYIDPLVAILDHQNKGSGIRATDEIETPSGVFDKSPNTTLVLLLDFKTDGTKTWAAVQEQLEPLRQRDMLTSWNGNTKTMIQRPITVVGTGNTPFNLVLANSIYRDIFFDAPLDNLNNTYTSENSYYASVSFQKSVGKVWFRPSASQADKVNSQIEAASQRGLKARYWDIPNWPISRRNKIWTLLVESGIGVLNVDDVSSAGRWNWDWCIVAGLSLCG